MSRIRANTIVDSASTGAPTFPNGAIINGISTITANVQLNTSQLTIGTGTTISNPSDNEFRILTNGSERVRVDSSGKVGINTEPVKALHVHATAANQYATARVSGRSRGGQLEFATDTTVNAGMYAPTSTDELVVFTSASETEQARFTSNGLKFPSGKGIDFSATADGSGTMTSELLDDYEEGTFTPTLRDAYGGGGTAATVGIALGSYTKIGNMCNMMIRLSQITDKTGMTSGNALYVGNLPFSIKSIASNAIFIGPAELSNFNTDSGCVNLCAFVNASTEDQTDIRLFQTIDNAGHDKLLVSNMNTASNTEIFINLTVPVA